MTTRRPQNLQFNTQGTGGFPGRALLLALALSTAAACGRKGPPQVPFVRVPAAAEVSGARRVGGDVYVTVKVPAANVDNSRPASLREIEVYGVTATTPPPAGAPFLSIATLVATIPVARDADPADRSGTVVADPATGALQGDSVTIRDAIDADDMIPRELPALPRPVSSSQPASAAAPAAPQALRRFYMAVTYAGNQPGDRRRPGPPGPIAALPLTALPDPVPSLTVAAAGRNIVVDWAPSGGLLGWLFERALPPEVAPLDAPATSTTPESPTADLPPGPTLYNVYRDISPDPLALPVTSAPSARWTSMPDTPINAAPMAALMFTEEVAFDERTRCYHVRAVRGSGAQTVESAASDRRCLAAVDFDPPDAPTELSAVADEGALTVSWDPNGEEDLRGYVVLRREAADDTLLSLTETPIRETRYVDRAVTAGRTYTYVVRAVDSRLPLGNLSEPATVTETAR